MSSKPGGSCATVPGAGTRLVLESNLGNLVADVPAIWALSMPPLTRVAVRIDPAGVRLVVL
ncbi:MAG TPA: hypothetical protein VIJ07_19695 [Dermatophilaceae bacterium]